MDKNGLTKLIKEQLGKIGIIRKEDLSDEPTVITPKIPEAVDIIGAVLRIREKNEELFDEKMLGDFLAVATDAADPAEVPNYALELYKKAEPEVKKILDDEIRLTKQSGEPDWSQVPSDRVMIRISSTKKLEEPTSTVNDRSGRLSKKRS